jgi:hypothetical protein
LYEDAFENLSLENGRVLFFIQKILFSTIFFYYFSIFKAPNFKSNRIVIEMINQLGLDEAGIDGGGLFREFLLKLLETSFDPNRGFFVLTSDGFCYPNPNIKLIIENFEEHYFFLGRILAKVSHLFLLFFME